MAFTLLSDDPLWVVRYEGAYVNRVWVDGVPVVTPIEGLIEPYKMGQEGIPLPEGNDVEDAFILSTEVLTLRTDDPETEQKADYVTLEDPEVITETYKYRVAATAPWSANSSFSLIPSYKEYLLIRERTS